MIEILRQRLFISHDHKEQRSIVSEYTIKSKRKELTNIIILSDKFLLNLLVRDEDDSILPVMTTRDVKKLINHFIEKSSNETQEKLEHFNSKINAEELHMIWIKIPKNKSLYKNEVRTFTLNYSPHHIDPPRSVLKMKIKKQPYPLYYTLFTPNDFDFAQTRYGFIKDGKIKQSYQQPEYVQKFRTYNSNLFRIISDIEESFEISYSFKPTRTSTAPTKIGLFALAGLSSVIVALKYIVFLGDPPDVGIFTKQIEIGLFVIGGSLLLPQLTNNYSIRARYTLVFVANCPWNCDSHMKTNLSEREHMTSSVKDSDILALYDCDENSLAYMIEPKGSVEITDEDSETTKEDLENIL